MGPGSQTKEEAAAAAGGGGMQQGNQSFAFAAGDAREEVRAHSTEQLLILNSAFSVHINDKWLEKNAL